MTDAEFRKMFDSYIEELYNSDKMRASESAGHNWVSGRLPFDTGKLANQAFQLIKIDDGHYQLKINTGVTPYAISINEKQRFYTYNYWKDYAEHVAMKMSDDLKGDLTDENAVSDAFTAANNMGGNKK
jgi:hypothetical protein